MDSMPSPMIRASDGAEREVTRFYATTTATTHNPRLAPPPLAGGEAGSPRAGTLPSPTGLRLPPTYDEAAAYFVSAGGRWWPRAAKPVRAGSLDPRSSYSRNVLPHVEYDARVDETPHFRWVCTDCAALTLTCSLIQHPY